MLEIPGRRYRSRNSTSQLLAPPKGGVFNSAPEAYNKKVLTYLLRVNLDIKEKPIEKALRFKQAVSSIAYFGRRGKVVIISHRGRPQSRDASLSLRPYQELISRALKRPVFFFPDFDFGAMAEKIRRGKKGDVFLVENIRFLPGESRNDPRLAKKLATLGDCYVNDDFATSHRKDTSLVAITKFLPSEAGPLLKEEIKRLSRAMIKPPKPFALIIGGVKVVDKVGVIKNLLPKTDAVLIGGASANTFLKLKGVDLKESLYEPAMLETARKLLGSEKVFPPLDWCWGNNQILDIGPKTISLFKEKIGRSRLVVWNGPMGLFEKKEFSRGSRVLVEAILKGRSEAIIGGGETTSLFIGRKLPKDGRIFLSAGGGAMLLFLAGQKLPALEALKKQRR